MSKTCRSLIAALLLFKFAPFSPAAENAGEKPEASANPQIWPAVALRGYGTLSGESHQWTLPAGPASILTIHCDDPDKAKIVHAKYLSDLSLLPGVQQRGGDIPHLEIAGSSNSFTAARADSIVYLFQASSPGDLATLVSQHATEAKGRLIFTPEAEVPMFLDRWDRFGFRFYYQPSTPPKPKGQTAPPYDFTQDFDFAEKSGHAGLVLWDQVNKMDSAAGLMTAPNWSWAMEAARARKLPVAINDSFYSPLWLTNRYRDQTMFKAQGFLGTQFAVALPSEQEGMLSWTATSGRDAILSQLQQTIRRFNSYPNLVSWLDPDGEIPISASCLLTEYGPAPDASYRRYLQDRYHDLATVSQRWYGDARRLASWNDVHVPQLAYFRGCDEDAIDLAGKWRINYEQGPGGKNYTPEELNAFRNAPIPTTPAPEEWHQPDFDDSAWPALLAPGDDRALFLPKRPAIFRRTFDLGADALKKSAHWYLYIWDLNSARTDKMWACINGQKVGESVIFPNHWAAFEVTGAVHGGTNQVTLRLPNGFLGYRIYLSSQPIRDYPDLGEKKNAEWVDFTEWGHAARIDSVRRSIEMIRQIDPNRQITFMHPEDYGAGLKEIAEDFGGEFHCTGYMSAFFSDLEPQLMRGSDLPSSLEPGGPATNLEGFKHQIGLNLCEGVQGLDYFQRLTDVLWHEDIRKYFDDHLDLLHTFGKFHPPKAEIAMLSDDKITVLTGYPWGADPNVLLHSGYWNWNVTAGLLRTFATDGVTAPDFARGNAAKYRVIIDSNTTIMDEELVGQIEDYVRKGGIFITCAQTGRHTPTKLDAWPIERLTGYHVSHIDQFAKGNISESQPVHPAPNQDVFTGENWNTGTRPNGLSLEKVAPDCQDLMLWQNGKTAVGLRPLGQGFIVEVGVKFAGAKISDRLETKPRSDEAAWTALYTSLLEHFHIARLPAALSDPASPVLWRHYVSNNGLFDVWTLWNQSKDAAQKVSLQFQQGLNPTACFEIKNQPAAVPIAKLDSGSALENLQLEPKESRVFLTPRPHLENAGAEWFQLQRNWWRGTAKIRKSLAPFHDDFTLDLSDDWAFQPVKTDDEAAAMISPASNDSKWERRPLGAWGISDHPGVQRALLRKTFTIPANWKQGQVRFWLTTEWTETFVDSVRIYVDGKQIPAKPDGVCEIDGGGSFLAGSKHVIAVDVQGAGSRVGVLGSSWLSYLPDPQAVIGLAGDWKESDDYLTFGKTLAFPGKWDAVLAEKSVQIDHSFAGKSVFLDFDGPVATSGIIINGVWVGHHRNYRQSRWEINITPWIKFGAENVVQLIGARANSWDNSHVASVKLDIYDPGVYP